MAASKRPNLVKEGETKTSTSNSNAYIPEEIVISQILTRVPAKSLLEFRCVCRYWSVVILSDSKFLNKLSVLPLSKSASFIFHSHHEENKITSSFLDIGTNVKTDILFLPEDLCRKPMRILYSLRGLLLVSLFFHEDEMWCYYVFNPITRKYRTLPALQVYQEEDNCIFSLAYDSVASKYKVVCLGFDKTGKYYAAVVTVGVNGPWRVIDIPDLGNAHVCPPVFANGSVYRMMGGVSEEDLDLNENQEYAPERSQNIVYMDATEESFGALVVPNSVSGVYSLLEIRGLLCYVNHVSKTRLDLWLLIENMYGGQANQEWVLECSVDVGDKFPFKGFRDGCFPLAALSRPKKKILFKFYDPDNNEDNWKCFFCCYDFDMHQLDEVLLVDTYLFFAYGYAGFQKYYPCIFVRSLASF